VEVQSVTSPLSIPHMIHDWICISGGVILMGKLKNMELDLFLCPFVYH
jgi:hypothetical protein